MIGKAGAFVPRPVQLHCPKPHLDAIVLRMVGQRPFGRKRGELPGALGE
jgi:hypothetical protein